MPCPDSSSPSSPSVSSREPVLTTTENNATAYKSTGNKCLDLFVLTTRNMDSNMLRKLFVDAMKENSRECLQIIYHLRDPRGGKGEKELSLLLLSYLSELYRDLYSLNLATIVNTYGCHKMLCEIYARDFRKNGKKSDQLPLQILVNELQNGSSLAAKWTPSEKSHYQHKTNGYQHTTICFLMGFYYKNKDGHARADSKKMRKFLTPKRVQANIIESFLAQKKPDPDFSKVASRAMLLYSKKAFPTHYGAVWEEYLKSVKDGKSTIKTTCIHPHEIIHQYISSGQKLEESSELLWNAFTKELKAKGNLSKALAICDVSGSMYGTRQSSCPINISIAISLCIADVSTGPFANMVLAFSRNANLIHIESTDLAGKIDEIIQKGEGYETNLIAAFRSILNHAIAFKVAQEDLPTIVFVITDMEFDNPSIEGKTPHQVMADAYNRQGYTLPKIVYWNVASRSGGLPVTHLNENVALVSGFSTTLLTAFMDDDIETALNPILMMRKILKPYKPVMVDVDQDPPLPENEGETW